MSLGFNGIATELGLECDCSDSQSHWFLSPLDFLQFRAEWLPYLDRFSAAVHSSELPHFEGRQLSYRQQLLLGKQCPEEADLEPKVPKALPRFLGGVFVDSLCAACTSSGLRPFFPLAFFLKMHEDPAYSGLVLHFLQVLTMST